MKIYKVYVLDSCDFCVKEVGYYINKKKAKKRLQELRNQYCGYGTEKLETIKVIK